MNEVRVDHLFIEQPASKSVRPSKINTSHFADNAQSPLPCTFQLDRAGDAGRELPVLLLEPSRSKHFSTGGVVGPGSSELRPVQICPTDYSLIPYSRATDVAVDILVEAAERFGTWRETSFPDEFVYCSLIDGYSLMSEVKRVMSGGGKRGMVKACRKCEAHA